MARNKIIGVDFDGTLAVTRSSYPRIQQPISEILEYVIEEKQNGAEVILITMREGKELEDAVEWCRKQGLEFDAVNDNLPYIQEYFRGNPRKIFFNEYIDDRNVGGITYIINEIRAKKEAIKNVNRETTPYSTSPM